MDSTTLDRLTQRVDRLERQVHRWKLAGCLSVLGLVSVALMGTAEAASMTGTEWNRLEKAAQLAYVAGVLDISIIFAESHRGDTFSRPFICAVDRRMIYTEVLPIVEQYMWGHGGAWSAGMPDLIRKALDEGCR